MGGALERPQLSDDPEMLALSKKYQVKYHYGHLTHTDAAP